MGMQSYRDIKNKKVQFSVDGVGTKACSYRRNKVMTLTVGEILLSLLAEKGGWI